MRTEFSSYLKAWIGAKTFAYLMNKDIKVEKDYQKIINAFLFKSKNLKASFENMSELLLLVFKDKQSEFLNSKSGVLDTYNDYLEVGDMDDLFYILLGRFEEENYDKKCFKQCWNEFFSEYVRGNYKQARDVLENYKNKKCGQFGAMNLPEELPKHINGGNL